MRYWFLFLISIFAACRDQYPAEFNPKDASQLEGLWHNEPQPAMPQRWVWHFSDGLLTRTRYDFDVALVDHFFAFETRADSLFLREVTEPGNAQTFTIYFDNDSTAAITDVTNTIHFQYKLKRF